MAAVLSAAGTHLGMLISIHQGRAGLIQSGWCGIWPDSDRRRDVDWHVRRHAHPIATTVVVEVSVYRVAVVGIDSVDAL